MKATHKIKSGGKVETSLIHSTTIIDPKATIGKGVSIGPYSIIGPEVTIRDNTEIENHVTIKGRTTIGSRNYIGPYTSIGLSAQDKAHRNEPTEVIIGNENEIREYVSIHRGTFGGTGVTSVGSHNQIMGNVHFAHDVSVGNHCMLANGTALAGHVVMGSYVVTGGMSGIHQFCRIGDYAMLGATSTAYQDVVPYMTCIGHRAQIVGLNLVGMERNGLTTDDIRQVQSIFNIFFNSGIIPKKAIDRIKEEIPSGQIQERFLNFVSSTQRGFISKA